jgi:hypothetical protein
MKIGEAGDNLSLVRVILAMLVGAIVLGGIGYGFDRAVGPAINMDGWWTVFASGGLILGGMLQAAREWAVPQPAERREVAARLRAREEAEARAAESEAAGSATAPDGPASAEDRAAAASTGDQPASPARQPRATSGSGAADAAPDRVS